MLLTVIAPVDWLPEVATVPDHAPEAEQAVAFVDDQVSTEDAPLATDVGLAAIDAVTVDPVAVVVVFPRPAVVVTLPVPLQAASARTNTRMSSEVLVRNIGPHSFFP